MGMMSECVCLCLTCTGGWPAALGVDVVAWVMGMMPLNVVVFFFTCCYIGQNSDRGLVIVEESMEHLLVHCSMA